MGGRSVGVKKNGVTTATYDYDLNGNRISLTDSTGTITGSYDDQDRMLSYGAASNVYGKRGNLQAKVVGTDTTHYFYDNLGNLNSVILPDGTIIDYVIDGQNRRVGKKVNGVVTKKWIYQDQLDPVAELNASDSVIVRYVYGTRANVPDYMVKNGETYRVVSDHLGSVRMVVNTNTGVIEQRLDYNEYGNIISNLGTQISVLTYAGGLYDEHTGLIRFGARDYDPITGRWTAKDPIGFGGGVSNLYEYVLNDPINMLDINGKQNITKLATALGNWANGIRLGISGSLKYMAALGTAETGLGALGFGAWGTWNLNAGLKAFERGNQQWNEGVCEDFSDANLRNLLGLLPYGTEFDDPGERSMLEVYTGKSENMLEFISQLGFFF